MAKPNVFVIYYSMYGHVQCLAKHIMRGLEASDVNAKIYQIAETLLPEVLCSMSAPLKDTSIPVITTAELPEADGKITFTVKLSIIFISKHCFKVFLLAHLRVLVVILLKYRHFLTNVVNYGLVEKCEIFLKFLFCFNKSKKFILLNDFRYGKFVGTFFSTSSIGGGQESTTLSMIPFFTHLGMIYVPFGYKNNRLSELSVHGGSPYGSGMYVQFMLSSTRLLKFNFKTFIF